MSVRIIYPSYCVSFYQKEDMKRNWKEKFLHVIIYKFYWIVYVKISNLFRYRMVENNTFRWNFRRADQVGGLPPTKFERMSDFLRYFSKFHGKLWQKSGFWAFFVLFQTESQITGKILRFTAKCLSCPTPFLKIIENPMVEHGYWILSVLSGLFRLVTLYFVDIRLPDSLSFNQ